MPSLSPWGWTPAAAGWASVRSVDLRRLLSLVRRCSEATEPAGLAMVAAAGLRSLLHADVASYVEVPSAGTGWDAVAPVEAHPQDFGTEFLAAHAAENPLVAHALTHPADGPRTWSDFVSVAQMRRTEVFNLVYRPMGVDHQLAVCLAGSPSGFAGVSAERAGRDFTDRERDLLKLARPHLRALRERALLLDSLRRATGVAEPAVVGVDRLGRVLHCSAAAQVLLGRYFGVGKPAEGVLPAGLADWLTAARQIGDDLSVSPPAWTVARAAGVLGVRYLPGVAQDLIVLKESAPGRVGQPFEGARAGRLTMRETQVLQRVARGDSNAEIAAFLGLSVRTVEKHMQRILEKLDVANRAAAVRFALPTPEGPETRTR